MFSKILILILCVLHLSCCSWISEWMSPIQQQLHGQTRRLDGAEDNLKSLDDLDMPVEPTPKEIADKIEKPTEKPVMMKTSDELSTAKLKLQLENALQSAESLVKTLKAQITAVSAKEHLLKEAIANGRAGVSTVTVSTIGQAPRTYIIRDGFWTVCNGMVQFPPAGKPPATSMFSQMFAEPRCIGQEVQSQQDPCVFNSLIKYDIIPTRRGLEYREEDYICLKSTFKNTLEQYLSVPKKIINDTCTHGTVKSVTEYSQQCGVRIMSEYSYFPHRSTAALVPLEYCTEKDGSCKMIVAWHLTNATIENFEFLKDEYNFKKYFMKPDQYVEHVM